MSTWTRPGINHVGEYQCSGYAFCVPTGTGTRTVELKYVSRAITVTSSATSGTVTFFADDGTSSVFTFGAAGTQRFEIRCKKFALGGAATTSAVVECTSIRADSGALIPAPADLGTVI